VFSKGTYNEQLYVQPSVHLVAELEEANSRTAKQIGTGTAGADASTTTAVSMPRVRWKPYIATGTLFSFTLVTC